MKTYFSLFNSTEILAILESFPAKRRRDIWINNFMQEDFPTFTYYYRFF